MENSINLELIVEGPKQTKILNVHSHVNKYLETIIYSKKIQEAACPLDYFENSKINSDNNMFIFDKSFSLDDNIDILTKFENKFFTAENKIITSAYKDILITNIIQKSKDGTEVPLFYKHVLPPNTKECDIEIVTNMNEKKEFVYKIDYNENSIYTNSKNYYDPKTEQYLIYYIISVNEQGESSKKILTPIKNVQESTWEDVDLSTGKIKEGLIRYTVEKNNSGFTFRMTENGPWYWKGSDYSNISILKPESISYKNAWNIRIKNGEFKTFSNGKFVRYHVPEFKQQAFNPFAPYNFGLSKYIYYVNDKTLCFTHKNAAVYPSKRLHLEILAYDENEELIEVFTTDTSKKGSFFRDKNIRYKTESIEDWDNESGMIVFNEKLPAEYTYYGNYFSELKTYEMKEISFNPLQNKDIKNYSWIIYCIPNLDDHEKAIHYLGVDRDGIIRYCSQKESSGYPNFGLRNSDGSFNSNTILGKKYKGNKSTEFSFINNYSSNVKNDFQYLILGEIYIVEKELKDNSFLADVRVKEKHIKKESLASVILRNPRILQSKYCYGDEGQEYAKNNVLIYNIPITVLKDYGGSFNEREVMNVLKKTSPVSKKILLNYTYKVPEIKVDNTEVGKNKFEMSWEGPNLIYRMYKKDKDKKGFEVVSKKENPESKFIFEDTDISKMDYYYCFSIEENGIEYPKSNVFTVRGT
tara:strand:- start:9872 stop:11959 length:2088 start_codon:yes stop_codon:yes gene_type:complete